jgi:hypothetical protein
MMLYHIYVSILFFFLFAKIENQITCILYSSCVYVFVGIQIKGSSMEN